MKAQCVSFVGSTNESATLTPCVAYKLTRWTSIDMAFGLQIYAKESSVTSHFVLRIDGRSHITFKIDLSLS